MRDDAHYNVRCRECRQRLFPNFMEGCWEHFAPGCRFSRKQHFNGDDHPPKEAMAAILKAAGE